MRSRRYYVSGKVYEFCFRAKQGLPFPALLIINLIIKSAMARAQRDNKLLLCHYVWMGNHVHIIAVVLDAKRCAQFYAELQKRITDCVKQLLGLENLDLWEERPMGASLLNKDTVIERIAYCYGNPSRAHLVQSINDYPGVSSWQAFSESKPTIEYRHSESVPWIRLPQVKALPSQKISKAQDFLLYKELKAGATISHDLVVFPNAWMKAFGIKSEEEILEINRTIRNRVKNSEEIDKLVRLKLSKTVIGRAGLMDGAIMREHKPAKKTRRIFVMSTCSDLRIAYIRKFKEICVRCAILYRDFCRGIHVTWPPGCFPPACVPLANAV